MVYCYVLYIVLVFQLNTDFFFIVYAIYLSYELKYIPGIVNIYIRMQTNVTRVLMPNNILNGK